MKKIIFPLLAIAFTVLYSCNSSDKNETKGDPQKNIADSLEKLVDEGHNVGMAKYGKLKSMKFQAERMLDSIAKLPARAKEAAAPLKAKLDGLVQELNDAKEGMDKWMREYDMDSAIDNLEQRIKYLSDETQKVGKVKEAILGSLQRADSILKSNF